MKLLFDNEWREVASLTDAWIETTISCKLRYGTMVASLTDAWIETQGAGQEGRKKYVASLTDAWIETILAFYVTLRYNVASLTDAWIETYRSLSRQLLPSMSHPSRMRGLKLLLWPVQYRPLDCRIPHGCVD
mgnify:CR=1 FL=1